MTPKSVKCLILDLLVLLVNGLCTLVKKKINIALDSLNEGLKIHTDLHSKPLLLPAEPAQHSLKDGGHVSHSVRRCYGATRPHCSCTNVELIDGLIQ